MTPSLLNYPPELIIQVLSFLPVQSLLRFGQTSRYSQSLANSSLHTLSLGVHQSRLSALISQLATAKYPQPKQAVSAFSVAPQPSSSPPSSVNTRRSSIGTDYLSDDEASQDPYRVSVLIPNAQTFNFDTLLQFNSALTTSILIRHGGTLRNLDLSLWTLTIPIARAISNLAALRALSIRNEDFPHVGIVPRSQITLQHKEQCAAWDLLTTNAVFASHLNALRLEGGTISTAQLARLLINSRWCHELWLFNCPSICEELWSWLGTEWDGRTALRILGVMRCGGQLGDDALDAIGGLNNLEFLSLQGHYALSSGSFEDMNKREWHIPEIIPPMPPLNEQSGETFIEVDPAYI